MRFVASQPQSVTASGWNSMRRIGRIKPEAIVLAVPIQPVIARTG